MDAKYVVIIQCDIAHRRCSGFACTNAFYNRDDVFQPYEDTTKYISFTCGGCCGKGVSSKLEHFTNKIAKTHGLKRCDVAVHLASCMVTDNHHYDRCPHADYIKSIVIKKGYDQVVEGSYISRNATKKRASGAYHCYE